MSRENYISTTSNSLNERIGSKLSDIQSDVRAQAWYKRLLNKRNRRRTIRYSLLFANLTMLLVVAGFVLQKPKTSGTNISNAILATKEESIANPLDTLSSADIAVNVARAANLPEQVAVTNLADTVNAQLTVTPSDDIVVAQPQIIATGLKSRHDIQTYVVQQGDTVSSIAAKFGVTSDTIRWSNNLNGDIVRPGIQLTISPVNGIVHTVQRGDTIDLLVARYGVNRDQFIAFNDLEDGHLPVGERIVMPDGRPPVATNRASALLPTSAAGFTARYGYNGYDYGYCTWHAANRRAQAGRPIPANLGHARTWYSRAAAAGMAVGNVPKAGAVLWHANLGGLGHVAYVEAENADGSILVSDMNYPSWGRVTTRTVSPSEFGAYRFIY